MSSPVTGYVVGTFAALALDSEERSRLQVAVDPSAALAVTRAAEAFRGEQGELPLVVCLFGEPPRSGDPALRLWTAVDAALDFVEAVHGAGLIRRFAEQLQQRVGHLAAASRELPPARSGGRS